MFSPLEIKPETAEMLAAQAKSRGLSVDAYLRTLLPSANGDLEESHFYRSATPEEWVRAFRMWATSHAALPAIADDSRDSIYHRRGE